MPPETWWAATARAASLAVTLMIAGAPSAVGAASVVGVASPVGAASTLQAAALLARLTSSGPSDAARFTACDTSWNVQKPRDAATSSNAAVSASTRAQSSHISNASGAITTGMRS